MTRNKLKRLNLTKQLIDAKIFRAQNRLRWFIDYTMPSFQCQWFNELVCKEIDNFLKSTTVNKLAIFQPPQTGKSETVSRRLPAYILGRNPNLKVVAASYSADLSSKFNREVQRIIDEPNYKKLFPETMLKGNKVLTLEDIEQKQTTSIRTLSEFEIVNHSGFYKSVGIGGNLTGQTCDFGIIDDPIKDSLQANSLTYRNRLWDWYNDVFLTRLHNKSKIIYCQTRWHDDDLWGRILKKEDDWKVIVLPGLKEDNNNPYDIRKIGEALWEEKHSAKSYREAQQRSPRTFASLIQQRPAPLEGNIFLNEWFRFYNVLPDKFEKIIQSWDCTFKDKKDGDFVVGTIWGKYGPNLFLLGILRGHWDFVKTIDMFKKAISQFPNTSTILVEDKANGSAIISVLKQHFPGIIAINPRDSKEQRAYAITQYFEAGNIWFPKIENAPWVETILTEMKIFPNGAHDDIVDTVTQVIKHTFLSNNSWTAKIAI